MPPEIADLISNTSSIVIVSVCVGLVFTLVIGVGVTVLAIRLIRKATGPDRSILQNGISAKARILGLQQTSMMVNNQPQVAFNLEVHPPQGVPYQAQLKAVIPMVNIPQLQPGVEVPVKIDPKDPTKVVMDIYQ